MEVFDPAWHTSHPDLTTAELAEWFRLTHRYDTMASSGAWSTTITRRKMVHWHSARPSRKHSVGSKASNVSDKAWHHSTKPSPVPSSISRTVRMPVSISVYVVKRWVT